MPAVPVPCSTVPFKVYFWKKCYCDSPYHFISKRFHCTPAKCMSQHKLLNPGVVYDIIINHCMPV